MIFKFVVPAITSVANMANLLYSCGISTVQISDTKYGIEILLPMTSINSSGHTISAQQQNPTHGKLMPPEAIPKTDHLPSKTRHGSS